MRTSINFVRGLRTIHGRFCLTAGASLLALTVTWAVVAPAGANAVVA